MGKHAVATVSDPSECGKAYHVLKEIHIDGTNDALLIAGIAICPGRCRWVTVVAANTAAQKDAAVLAALNA